ncbi:hypothetical protein [Actinomadura sp. HBU206391]|uniref:hypothetical protein n=1 Tax=Actinomadura sp. HBU206391 TaxID=2731692 RepID=UPI0016500111|nr:hypothetical protein [Actinomadura sp. HBU206391]MBC6458085.1 hypothetical protein [Actinomadura sp. HBU206391]
MSAESPTRFVMVPARRSDEPTARRRARRILGALFLAAGLSAVSVFVALSRGQSEADLSAVDPQGRELAHTAAVTYLAGGHQNVPHATSFDPEDTARAAADLSAGRQAVPLPYRSLNWVGFTPQHFGSENAGFTDFEVHHFLVALGGPVPTAEPRRTPRTGQDSPNQSATAAPTASPQATASPTPSAAPSSASAPNGPAAPTPGGGPASAAPSGSPGPASDGGAAAPPTNVLLLDVPVLVSEQGPRLAAAPAFSTVRSGVGEPAGKGDYTNYGNLLADVSESVKNQVAAWARAYVTGDSTALLTLTGDQNSTHHYLGLSGFTLPASGSAVQIQSAIRSAAGRLIVRVRVLLARPVPGNTVSSGNTAEDDATGPQFTTYADFDLLVGAPTGARPPILAWGPAGSAAELEPYSNALTRP